MTPPACSMSVLVLNAPFACATIPLAVETKRTTQTVPGELQPNLRILDVTEIKLSPTSRCPIRSWKG
jgi:hypothetical protein